MTAPIWTTDMRIITGLQYNLDHDVSAPDRDGSDALNRGFKSPQDDPRWLFWLTVVMAVMAALSVPLILIFH